MPEEDGCVCVALHSSSFILIIPLTMGRRPKGGRKREYSPAYCIHFDDSLRWEMGEEVTISNDGKYNPRSMVSINIAYRLSRDEHSVIT